MKTIFKKLSILILAIALTTTFGCTTVKHPYPYPSSKTKIKTLPPGQMKKVSGEKSAKKYAPGQRKKQGY